MNKLFKIISVHKLIILILVLVVSVSFFIAKSKQKTEASVAASNSSSKYFTSIYVESGDTLWGIATRYKTEEYSSINDYMDEVIAINNLTSHNIIEGTYLLVPYYETKSYE